MPPRNTTIQLRTITIFGAGAALLAVFGYLLLKSDTMNKNRKKMKKKFNNENENEQQHATQTNANNEQPCTLINDAIDHNNNNNNNTIIKAPSPTILQSESLPLPQETQINVYNDKILDNCDETITKTTSTTTRIQEDMMKMNAILKNNGDNGDKISEISSDSGNGDSGNGESGNGESELLMQNNLNKSDTMCSNISQQLSSLNQSIPQSISSISIASSTQYADTDIVLYEFHFPRKYCGKLIGRNGVHVDYIRNKAHVQIAVRDDENEKLNDLQIVSITGYFSDVEQALDIISARFPARHYPTISFKPIKKCIFKRQAYDALVQQQQQEEEQLLQPQIQPQKVSVTPEMYVQLPAPNKTNQIDVHVSAIVNSSHLFIQLPSNPTYALLKRLDEDMLHLYLYSSNNETIPDMESSSLEYGTICAAPTSYGWHRAMIVQTYSSSELNNEDYYNCDMVTVKFLDYGGYLNLPASQLKQLRSDFMNLPFQAIECYLDDVFPIEGSEEEGKDVLAKLVRKQQLKAILTGYTDEYVPLIKLFQINNDSRKSFLINNELVALGIAQKA